MHDVYTCAYAPACWTLTQPLKAKPHCGCVGWAVGGGGGGGGVGAEGGVMIDLAISNESLPVSPPL